MTKKQSTERDEAITKLREWIKPGDTVYTILDHVSASGMSRAIRVVLPVARPAESSIHLPKEWKTEIDFLHPNYAVGKALDLRHWKRNGREQDALVLGGCGMDMGFHLVYELSHALYGSGYQCLGQGKCPSNYHSNHRNTVQCWTLQADDEPRCTWVRGFGWSTDDGQTLCPHCEGKGSRPNPAGPQRFDLLHTDGYALRHRWL